MISIPNYTLQEKIGEGGMAEVYRATHDILEHSVAIKVMSASLMKDKSFKDSFIKEGQTMKKLKHPHIVEIYDIGISDDFCYMVIELLEAESLKDKLAKAPLPVAETLRIIEQISAALRFAHDQGYIHRDIKPANILFRENGDAILTDFGISKLQGTAGDLTQMGYLIGSPYYMSPEQIQGGELDKRSDIYNLGIVFYEMLTGEKPFSGDTTVAISYEHIHADIPTLDSPFQLFQPVLNKVLQKDKTNRYSEITDFANTLYSVGEETQRIAPLPPNTQHDTQTEPPAPPKPYLKIVLFALSVIMIAGVGIYFIFYPSPPLIDDKAVGENKITTSSTENNKPIEQNTAIANPPSVTISKPTSIPAEDHTPLINLLLDKSLSNLSSAITTYTRINKEQQSIEKLKSLPAESSRTKFITTLKIAILEAEKTQLKNTNKYCSSVIELGQHSVTLIEKQLKKNQATFITQYTNPAYATLKQFLLMHLRHAETAALTKNKCSQDVAESAKKFSAQH